MPFRDWAFRIADILGAISAVQQYTADMKFEDFAADRKTVEAVGRTSSSSARLLGFKPMLPP